MDNYCKYDSFGDYKCYEHFRLGKMKYDMSDIISTNRLYNKISKHGNTYTILPGVSYKTNFLNGIYRLKNSEKNIPDCVEVCNYRSNCVGFIADKTNGQLKCKYLSRFTGDPINYNNTPNADNISTYVKNNFQNKFIYPPKITQGKCDDGYIDVTFGKQIYNKCGEKCKGGKYLTDNLCNCACKRIGQIN